MTTEPTTVDEAALLKAFERASALLRKGTSDAAAVLPLEEALRPGASLREVRDVMVPLLDAASLHGLAAAWDVDMEALTAARVISRAERWLVLGAPELAADVLSRATVPGVDLTFLQRRVIERTEADLQQRQATFARNLDALKTRQPLAAAMIARMDRALVVLKPIGAGVVQRGTSGANVILQAVTPERAVSEARDKLQGLSWEAGTTCIAGAADGALLMQALDHGPRSDYGLKARSVIALCDVNAAAVRAVLEAIDVSDAIDKRYLRIYAGVDLEAQLLVDFARPMTARPGALLGECQVSRAILKRLRERVTAQHVSRMRRANEQTVARAPEIRQRFRAYLERKEPLRITLLSSRVSTYARHGVAASAVALRTLGHDVQLLEAPDEVTPFAAPDIAEAIEKQKADAVFAINFTRGTVQAVARPVAFVTWDMDGCGYVEQSLMKKQIGAHDHVLLRTWGYPTQIGWPAGCSHPYPTPFNRALVDAASHMGAVKQVAEVGYISNYHSVVERDLEQMRATCKQRLPDLLPTLERMADEVLSRASTLPPKRGAIFGAFMRGVTDPTQRLRHRALARDFEVRVVAPTYRQKQIQAVSDAGLDLALYGMGWENHPTLKKHARGLLEGPTELARGYLEVPVQLQVIFGVALHQRLIDGMAIGACMAVLPYPTDFAGRVRRVLDATGNVEKPASMTTEQLDYMLDELRSYSVLVDMREQDRLRYGFGRLGLATDDVIDPDVLDRASALHDTTLVDKVRTLLGDGAQREALRRDLRTQAEQALSPEMLLTRALDSVARVESGAQDSSRGEAAE